METNIKVYLTEMGQKNVDLINLAQLFEALRYRPE